MKKITVTTTCILFLLVGCVQSDKSNNVEDIKAITAVSEAIAKAWNDGSYEGFISHFDNDAIVLPPNAPSIVGIDALKALYSGSFKTFRFDVTETLDEVTVFGDYGYTVFTWVGSMTPISGGEPIPFNNKAIGIYKRQSDGRWLVYRNIYNSNEEMPVQKSPELSE